MAAFHIVVYMFLTVTLLGGGFGVSDEEFQVSYIVLKLIQAKVERCVERVANEILPYVIFSRYFVFNDQSYSGLRDSNVLFHKLVM